MSSRKRKNRPGRYPTDRAYTNNFLRSQHPHPPSGSESRFQLNAAQTSRSEPDPALFIVAHEADVIRGPHAKNAAVALEVKTGSGREGDGVGSGLIKWDLVSSKNVDEEGKESSSGEADAVWVDRYDARLLLTSPLTLPHSTSVTPSTSTSATATLATRAASPSGWSDLPSDSEDTFFFQPSEVEEYRNVKRRRLMEENRKARMKAIQEEDGNDGTGNAEDEWGGSDEEPPEPQRQIMSRTATHILTSPNPSQLEMRILANHGADPRFAFLKGRWKRTWAVMKARVRKEMEEKEREEKEAKEGKGKGLGVLMAYDDSDEEDSDNAGSAEKGDNGDQQGQQSEVPTGMDGVDGAANAGVDIAPVDVEQGDKGTMDVGEEARKEARRARAKEWAEKRRLQKLPSEQDLPSQKEDDSDLIS